MIFWRRNTKQKQCEKKFALRCDLFMILFNLVLREAVPSEGFQKMELKRSNTLHVNFSKQEIVSGGAWSQQMVEINK
jgi:hypothetical protein